MMDVVALGASPIGWIIAGISLLAGAAFLIYRYWQPIGDFFSGLWDGVKLAFSSVLDWVMSKIEWVTQTLGKVAKFFGGGDEAQEKPKTSKIGKATQAAALGATLVATPAYAHKVDIPSPK